MVGFALIWSATGHGPAAVALVSTVSVLPPLALLLFGGALGDRLGPRRMLLVATSAQLTVALVLACLATASSGVAFLASASALTATISAFRQPAAIIYPRLLISDDAQFSRALARISASVHAARILGVAGGGIAVAAWSLTAVLAMHAGVLALTLATLVALRPSAPEGSRPGGPTGSRASILDGLASARALRIGPMLLAVALVCAAVLPTVAVVLPSTARAHGWTAPQASLLEAGWAIGTLTITLLISCRGTLARQGLPLIGGPVLIAGALAALALPVSAEIAVALSALLGVGTAVFTTHIAPALLRLAPSGQLARFQSLLALVQLAPPAALNGPLAALSGSGHGTAALVICCAMSGAAAATIWRDRRRRAAPPRSASDPYAPAEQPGAAPKPGATPPQGAAEKQGAAAQR